MFWKFTEIARIEDRNFHNVLERFHANKMAGFIRESIQNSLDGKNHDNVGPVVVTINTGKINIDQLPGIDEIQERVKVLDAGNDYDRKTVSFMQKAIHKESVSYISIEDENTKGLSGAELGSKGGTFYSYAYNKGVHSTVDNAEEEKVRGGSHGIGKIAFNAASEINLMYFANCDEYNKKHLCGSAQLIEHEFNGKCYRSTGYFTDEINQEFRPYRNESKGIFEKNTRGLKIIVPYLRDSYQCEKDVIRSVCDSFFLAILNKKLVVKFNDLIIDENTIEEYILSDEYYVQRLEDVKVDFTPLYYQTLVNGEVRNISVKSMREEYNFKLFFNYNEKIKKGRTAIIRTIGMKIEDFKVKGKMSKPYNAVLVPISPKEDAFLKSLENESHTELSPKHFKDAKIEKNAKRFINNLSRDLGLVIEEYINQNNPVDGKMDTSDIIYDIENKFRTELEKKNSILKVNIGNKNRQLVKSGKESRAKKKNSGKGNKSKKKRKPREKNVGNGVKKPLYHIEPYLIKRINQNNKELLRFDLRDSNSYSSIRKCNIHYWFIDGMGKENIIDYALNTHIHSAKSLNGNEILDVNEDAIKNVPVVDGLIDLSLKLTNKYNPAMKFSYYLEVKE